jgi:hypothetical protein
MTPSKLGGQGTVSPMNFGYDCIAYRIHYSERYIGFLIHFEEVNRRSMTRICKFLKSAKATHPMFPLLWHKSKIVK